MIAVKGLLMSVFSSVAQVCGWSVSKEQFSDKQTCWRCLETPLETRVLCLISHSTT